MNPQTAKIVVDNEEKKESWRDVSKIEYFSTSHDKCYSKQISSFCSNSSLRYIIIHMHVLYNFELLSNLFFTSFFRYLISNSKQMKEFANEGNECENHFILRFPPEVAAKVRQFVEKDSHQTGNDRLGINFDNNLRTGTIQFEHDSMRFTLYDLPCIIEIMKTLDNKTIYKIVDLCQMIVVNVPKESKREGTEEPGESKSERYQWPDGICPPLKNVRRKRFRRIKKKKYMEVADVERELKRLLRSDLEAISVRWEVVAAGDTEEAEIKQTEQANEEAASQQDDLGEYGLSLSESEDEQTNF